MTPAEIRTHLRYSGWASQRLLDAAKKLNPGDLTRNTGVSHDSILGTLSHIHFADRIWYSRVVDPNEPTRVVGYGETGRVRLTTLTKEFFVPRFLERDECERERPCEKYPWDGVRNVRPFKKLGTTVVEGVY